MWRLNPKFTAKQIQKDVGGAATRVSVSTMKSTLKLKGFTAQRAMKSPKLNKKQIKVCLDWAKKYPSQSFKDQKKKVVFFSMIWPPYSPDIAPIENCWEC